MNGFRRPILFALALMLLLSAAPGAQSSADYQALRKEMDLLRERLTALQQEVNQLKGQRAATPVSPTTGLKAPAIMPAENVVLNLAKAPIRGAESAPVTFVEVSDFECPFCARYSNQTSAQIVKQYVATGKIRYAFVQLPLPAHRNAPKAAEAAVCAGDQGKFWEMHDRLFANQSALALARLPESAAAIGLKLDAFKSCLDSSKHAALVKSDMAMVDRFGVRSTPTFFIGTMDPKTRVFKASRKIVGSKPLAIFQEALDGMIVSTATGAP